MQNIQCTVRVQCRESPAHFNTDMLVAIKTCSITDTPMVDFLTEASMLGLFEHPNIIFLQEGVVVTKATPITKAIPSIQTENCSTALSVLAISSQ